MKAAISAGLWVAMVSLPVASAQVHNVWFEFPATVKSNSVTVTLKADGEAPEFMAIIVETNSPLREWQRTMQVAMDKWANEVKTNRNARPVIPPRPRPVDYSKDAKWIPFTTNLVVDLGPGDGEREIMRNFKYSGQAQGEGWTGSSMTVQSLTPFIGITYPRQSIVSQPVILLKGYSSVPLQNIRYDVLKPDGSAAKTNEQGFVNDQHYDSRLDTFTTNYFTCYYIDLVPGTNTIVLRCKDYAGNETVKNLVYVLDLERDKTPPVISIDWPQPGMDIAAGTCTVRGKLDDATEQMTGCIAANGQTNIIDGEVEWSKSIDGAGYFWVERLPISLGTNYLTLTATDAAGNSTSTNLILFGVEQPTITMDPVEPAEKLWQRYLDVTGKVSPANNDVWINGVKAVIKPDGTWLAKNVPVVSPNVGTACFDMTSVPPEGKTNGNAKPSQALSSQASLGTNAMILNASYPACGVFRLHLSGTAGRSFVLQASTNLVAWMPILTNSNPDATFDFTDTNANNYPCRFFKVVPVQ